MPDESQPATPAHRLRRKSAPGDSMETLALGQSDSCPDLSNIEKEASQKRARTVSMVSLESTPQQSPALADDTPQTKKPSPEHSPAAKTKAAKSKGAAKSKAKPKAKATTSPKGSKAKAKAKATTAKPTDKEDDANDMEQESQPAEVQPGASPEQPVGEEAAGDCMKERKKAAARVYMRFWRSCNSCELSIRAGDPTHTHTVTLLPVPS